MSGPREAREQSKVIQSVGGGGGGTRLVEALPLPRKAVKVAWAWCPQSQRTREAGDSLMGGCRRPDASVYLPGPETSHMVPVTTRTARRCRN